MKVELFLRTPREIAAFSDFLKAVSSDYLNNTSLTTVADSVQGDARYAPEAELPEAAQDAKADTIPASSAPAGTVKRERGKPSPGHARRTKEEIAEDKAADEADAALKMAGEETGAVVPNKQVDERPLISTDPENRVGPEDTPEDQAQDAADEAAETAAAKAETGNKPTLDDIRTVLGNYQKVYGLPATMEDGPVVIGEVVAGAKKVSDVPEDKIAEVVAALKAAGKTNRFQRAVVTA